MKMKLKKYHIALTTLAVSIVAISVYFSAGNADAQQPTKTEPPVSTASSIPRHVGIFSAGSIANAKYTPNCPTFTFNMDATAIQESRDRRFVEAENARFGAIRSGWEAYEDCITENARRDIDVMRDAIGNNVVDAAKAEDTLLSAVYAAATAASTRLRNATPAKKKKDTAPEAAAAAIQSRWVKPVGRLVGSVTTGPVSLNSYVSACPVFRGDVTVADFEAVTSGPAFNNMLTAVNGMPPKIIEARTCRNENNQQDYDDVQKRIETGLNDVYVPAKTLFENQYQAVRTQLNLHRQPGGLLAPAGSSRPAAAAPKAKAKKKK